MSQEDGEELSEVFEEEEDTGIRKVYETKQIMTISKKIEQKRLVDEDVDMDMSPVSDIDSAVQEVSNESDHFEQKLEDKTTEKQHTPPVFLASSHIDRSKLLLDCPSKNERMSI